MYNNIIILCLHIKHPVLSFSKSLGDDVHGRSLSPPVLDYGVMVGGNTTNQQLRLANRGLAPLPLCLSITAKVRRIIVFDASIE